MSITSANAVITITVPPVFTAPFSLQGFSAEDVYTTESIAPAETMMGVDGFLTAGWTPRPVPWSVSLMADSPSNTLFAQWFNYQQQNREVYAATGVLILLSVGSKWNLVNGYLTGYPPMPNAARVLQPRRFGITWQATPEQPSG